MNLIDKFLDVMRLNDDEDDDDYEFANDDYFDDDDEYEAPKKKSTRSEKKSEPKNNYVEKERKVEKERRVERERENVNPITKITPIGRTQKKQGTGNGSMEVCVIKPTSIEDELEITETLMNGRTVIVNMEGLNVEIAQRIIDFISGSVYAMHGNLQKISNFIFLATPNGVDISGDIQNLMDAFGSNDGGFNF
jgi:cell division inhibitor SepF